MDDWWGTLSGWFDTAVDWAKGLFSSGTSKVDWGKDYDVNEAASARNQRQGSVGSAEGDASVEPSGNRWTGDELKAGASSGGILSQLGTTGSKVLDSVLGGDSRTTGLIAGLATGALKGYQDNRNINKSIAANAAQSEEAYQRLLKMRAVPQVGEHGSAVDFGVKFKGGQ